MTTGSAPTSRVIMDLRPGEKISFAGTGVVVEVVSKSGRASRLCVTSPRTVAITKEGISDRDAKHAMMPSP